MNDIWVVGISDCKILRKNHGKLITYSLGSCLGVAVYDKKNQIAGLIHCLLPKPISAQDTPKNPWMYVSTGLPLFLNKMIDKGSNPEDWQIVVAGCGRFGALNSMEIGENNWNIAKKILKKNQLKIHQCDVLGEGIPRTLTIYLENGQIEVSNRSHQ